MRVRTVVRRALPSVLVLLLLTPVLAACGADKPAGPATASEGVQPLHPAPTPETEATPAPTPNQVEAVEPEAKLPPATVQYAPEPPAAKPAQGPEPPAPPPPAETGPPDRTKPKLPGAISIIIENSWNARPQAGLDRADIIYEMESEYGITRFLALYYWDTADKIGPVRSARMHFYDVATAYGVPYAHAGGSIEVLRELKFNNQRLLNLDEIYTCGPCFWRGTTREPPHNLYTSTDLIVSYARQIGWNLKPLAGYPEGPAAADGKPVAEIAFHWGPETQNVSWHWNGSRYQRSQSGGPHVMENGVRVATDNLILLFTSWNWDGGSNGGKGSYQVGIVGQGTGYLYRDGKAWPIRWQKTSREDHYSLTYPDGSPVKVASGQIWIDILKARAHLVTGSPE